MKIVLKSANSFSKSAFNVILVYANFGAKSVQKVQIAIYGYSRDVTLVTLTFGVFRVCKNIVKNRRFVGLAGLLIFTN